MRPLEGITVVSFEQAVAAPLATRHLADLGARVIKVEKPPDGDFARKYDSAARGLSAYFVWLNRGKESIVLNLADPQHEPIRQGLIGVADVVVHNLAPGTAKRLQLTPTDLLERNPRLIACAISGYGSSGPYAERKAYDLLIQCEVAMLAVTGTPRRPAKVGISIADIAAGMYAHAAILAGLFQRERSGKGVKIEVSLFDALLEWMSQPVYATKYGAAPRREGARHASIAPYGPYRTADGATIFIAVQNESEWERLCRNVLRDPQLASDPRFHGNENRIRHRAALERTVTGAVASMTAAEFQARIDHAAIASARQNSVADLLGHPLMGPQRWVRVSSPAGDLELMRTPAAFGTGPHRDAIPAVGEHTQQILAELGFTRPRR